MRLSRIRASGCSCLFTAAISAPSRALARPCLRVVYLTPLTRLPFYTGGMAVLRPQPRRPLVGHGLSAVLLCYLCGVGGLVMCGEVVVLLSCCG